MSGIASSPAALRRCPVCDSPAAGVHQQMPGYRYLRCEGCRSLYLDTIEPDPATDRLYESAEYAERRGHINDEAVAVCKAATTAAYLRQLERHRPPGRRYLEIGCSGGAALASAAQQGWEAWGIEISAGAAAVARRQPGVRDVHCGTVLDAAMPSGSFDVITLFDVIEHIDPPAPTIQRTFDLLTSGGLILMVTPDADSLSARMLGARWPHLFPEHVVCLTRRALTDMLASVGFEVLQVGFAWKRVNLDMLVRHAQIHREVAGGALVRSLGRMLPARATKFTLPFNIGEFYVIARRPWG